MPMTVLVESSLTHSLTSSEMFSLMSSGMRSEVILESGIMKQLELQTNHWHWRLLALSHLRHCAKQAPKHCK